MREHVTSRTTYTVVLAALALLLVVSVVVARIDLGPANLVIAIGISVAKAILIVLFFMHVAYSSSLVRVFAFIGVLWLAFLLVLTAADYETRERLEPEAPPRPHVDQSSPSVDR